MYAYCNNNPSNFSDSAGTRPVSELERHEEISLPVPERKRYEKKIQYDVPVYDQGTYLLCWAFCMVMMHAYKTGQDLSQTQATKKAIAYAKLYNGANDWNKANSPKDAGAYVSVDSINDLYNLLEKSGPLYAHYDGKDGNGKKSGHGVIVTGANVTTNTVYTNNPWGKPGEQTFDDFLKGFYWDKPYPGEYELGGVAPANW